MSDPVVTDKYMMNGNKMLHHLDRVEAWRRGDHIAPIHIDAGLSKGSSTPKSSKKYFPRDALLQFVRDCGDLGVRSMALIGEAEPLLNPHAYEAIIEGEKAGVDMSMGTHGILLDTGSTGEEALENLTWIRFNVNAATQKDYARINGSNDFDLAIEKIKFCVSIKKKKNLPLTVGLQMALTPNNACQVIPLVTLGKELNVDYTVISQSGDTSADRFDNEQQLTDILKEAEAQSRNDYNVIVKWDKILNESKRNYDQCLGAPFLLHTSGDGKLYTCANFFDGEKEEAYRLGDLVKQSFKELIESEHYWSVIDKVYNCINVHKECNSHCRTNSINDFLWEYKDVPDHVDFI